MHVFAERGWKDKSQTHSLWHSQRDSVTIVPNGCMLGLRVDVCNRRALSAGVPAILSMLAQARVRASFFVTFGPDRSGLAVRRLLEPGFISKMMRTRAWRLYGIRTLLSGTLLPVRMVGEDFPALLRRIESEGHELGLHGWDHTGWLNNVRRMSTDSLNDTYSRARETFHRVVGHLPHATAAPGWRCTTTSLLLQDSLGFRYASDCRGPHPFRPRIANTDLNLLQVPTTLPTSDELIGNMPSEALPAYYLKRILSDPYSPHVLTVHAESEGMLHAAWMREFLDRAAVENVRIGPLQGIAELANRSAPSLPVDWQRIRGRAGLVASMSAPFAGSDDRADPPQGGGPPIGPV